MMEVLSNGAANLIQDLGRRGHLESGISRGGAMDTMALTLANALVGNDPGAAGIEVNMFPFRLRFQQDTDFATTGADCTVRLDDLTLAPWWRRSAKAGQTVVIEHPRRGARAYLAIGGGIDIEPILGSEATDLKGGFGGMEGRGLKRGDVLKVRSRRTPPVSKASGLGIVPQRLASFMQELSKGCVTVRFLRGAEYDRFTESARAEFGQSEYEVTAEANRVGYRLSGPMLPLTEHVELLSHGIVPGTVQVPSSGQPIVQMAEANTCGGYPKIATVIEADLWKLAQAPVGCQVRFQVTDVETAVNALREQADEYARIRGNLSMMADRD
ncbi:biotin-dependent carboxyltransferase family protein [Burkholderia latens]|uniref:Biotin-dependent carboxyltransferase family protein n=2 Tax=Burkholderia latens TaxID=488446 RepID=A0A6H9T144_9BURK|nr:biotin-dependent carboxyltransferase family protein [Burkholderia latens]HDR9882391.1 biotin-dependent carboxyltransferase family protein [Burkholderia cenocepacia]HDR9889743.1 biotin-dependent carboxyltransferase family protein [Burkholderia cenocepacia]